jgi:prepilin-type processing-associated H-X9-DG protein
MSWHTRILPYLEHPSLWQLAVDAFAQDHIFFHNPPHSGGSVILPVFCCPDDGRCGELSAPFPNASALTSYLGVEGVSYDRKDGVLFADSAVRLTDVRDGTSNTLMVGERPPSARLNLGWWYAGWGHDKAGSGDLILGVCEIYSSIYGSAPGCPRGPYSYGPGAFNNQCDAFHFWSPHPGGSNFLFCDGSVRFLSYSAEPIMPALATRAGGEHVSVPE